jgi:hypothetical protein
VNAKVLHHKPTFTKSDDGKTLVSLPVVASDDIDKDSEIFVSYGRIYWHSKLDQLPAELAEDVLEFHPL